MFGINRKAKGENYLKNKEERKAYAKAYYQKNKEAHLQRVKNWNKNHPWFMTYKNIRSRCEYPKDKKFKHYGGKGIKCLLSVDDVKNLWFKYKAENMKQASIDRINADGHYDIENCRFIEMEENRKRRSYK